LIFILNGPPGSGKDEACNFFEQKDCQHVSFKFHLFKATVEYYNVSLEWFMQDYDNRQIKEKAENLLHGLSRREALIYVSEKVIKPLYGRDYFGVRAAEELEVNGNYCFSDGGFHEELIPIINKLGDNAITLVQLTREGCDFSSDSRRYINGNLIDEFILGSQTPVIKEYILENKLPVRTYRVHNNATVQDLYNVLEQIHEKESNVRKINKKESKAS